MTALDLGEGVKQPIDSLIVQNRQAGRAVHEEVDGLDTGGRAGLRGGNGGNCPGPPAVRGPPVMKCICFK